MRALAIVIVGIIGSRTAGYHDLAAGLLLGTAAVIIIAGVLKRKGGQA